MHALEFSNSDEPLGASTRGTNLTPTLTHGYYRHFAAFLSGSQP